MTDIVMPPSELFLREETVRGGMDLLFFANTRYLKRADEKLAELELGRAHHRILYFVGRRPDMTVKELLAVLLITKQSFGRVAKELTEKGLLEQRCGERDRRHRLLRLTPAGQDLEQAIFDQLHDSVAQAYAVSGGDAVAGFWTVMQNLIGDEGRDQFRAVQSR